MNWKSLFVLLVMIPIASVAVLGCSGSSETSVPDEAANVAAFLLSPRSSGITAQQIVVDAGMSVNYFDKDIVARAMREQ